MATHLTLEALVSAIRRGASTDELLHMVGPSDEEAQEAKVRLDRLNTLDAKCEWDSMTPSLDAQQARERWEALMRVQNAYENMYC